MTKTSMRKKAILTVALVLILTGFQTSIISAAGNYENNMQAALKLRNEARCDEAINIYNRIISENPNDVDALVGRGFCYLQSKDTYERAEADFQKVVKETPTYIDAYYGLALINKRTGRWEEAKKLLDQAMTTKDLPDDVKEEVLLKKAEVFIHNKEYTKAISLLNAKNISFKTLTDQWIFLRGESYYALKKFSDSKKL